MPKGARNRLPHCLSRRELLAALKVMGAVFLRHGRHQEVWQVMRPDGIARPFPVPDLDDYDDTYLRRLFLHEIGLTKVQMLAAVNGDNPWQQSGARNIGQDAPGDPSSSI